MKTRTLFAILILFLVSCAGDKQAQLNRLQNEQEKIAEKIRLLREQTPVKDSLSIPANATQIAILTVQPASFNHFIEVFGKLDGDENVAVSARIGGTVEAIYHNAGEKVKKDQILAKLENQMQEKSLREQEASFKYQNDYYDKQKALWEQNVGSENDYLKAKSQKESLEARIASMKEQLDMYYIKAPINGTIEENNIKVGQTVVPGITVMRIVNFDKIKVVADLAESYATKVKEGDRVLIYFPDLKKEVSAVVNFSSRYINPVNRTFSVEARMKNDIPNLKANMVAVVKINDYRVDKAITLPLDVIQTDQQGNYVFLAAKEGKRNVARKINIKIGQSYNGFTEVIQGLKPGDRVISVGYQNLENGEAIRF